MKRSELQFQYSFKTLAGQMRHAMLANVCVLLAIIALPVEVAHATLQYAYQWRYGRYLKTPAEYWNERGESWEEVRILLEHFADTECQPYKMVDNLEKLSLMLEKLGGQSIIYIDLEAKALNRHGDIATLQIYDPIGALTYIVDVFRLGRSAFDTPAKNNALTLRSILEDPDVVKGIFDCRQDSNALYGLYSVHLRSVHDIQLMALACDIDRPASEWLPGLSACIRTDLPLDAAARNRMANAKDRCKVIFTTNGYGVFRMRPLPAVLIDYAVGDV